MFPCGEEETRNRGDNSFTAIATAGTRNTTEFSTHISAPAATWSFSGVKKQIRGASA